MKTSKLYKILMQNKRVNRWIYLALWINLWLDIFNYWVGRLVK